MMQRKRQSMPMMHQSLAAVLLPAYRRGFLGLLYLRPDEFFHGREISDQSALDPALERLQSETVRTDEW